MKTTSWTKQAIITFPGNYFPPDYVMFVIAGNWSVSTCHILCSRKGARHAKENQKLVRTLLSNPGIFLPASRLCENKFFKGFLSSGKSLITITK